MHEMTDPETIAAISTATGEGAIAIVRLSGPTAIQVADRIFRGSEAPSRFSPRTQHLGKLIDRDGGLIDQVMISVHPGPASYTGEDLVEISCHGGMLVSARVLELCLRSGARAARPGEFTERAFLNGKMDLTQAEAVIDLIRAKTDLALRSAGEQLQGRLGTTIKRIQDELTAVIAQLEASIDFAEEGIFPATEEELWERLDRLQADMSTLLATAEQGRIVREGVRAVIYGNTNAGKSSLLNRLLGYDRVIVSETHGTTRDTVEEMINLAGVPVRLLDTAGLRASADEVERQGIARTEQSLQQADLRLHIADANAEKPSDWEYHSDNGAEMVVLNKTDLPEHPDWRDVEGIRISCLTGAGLAELEKQIVARIRCGNLHPENMLAINVRHRDCLRRASEANERASHALRARVPPEYITTDLTIALHALGEIVGAVGVEDILDSVFSQFCIGK
jgi:tRNA modification GTPase